MSCILPGEQILKEDLERWANNLFNVLDSPRARKKFGEFLGTRRLDEAEMTLQFWEQCNRILLEAKSDDSLLKHEKLNLNNIPHSRFHKNVKTLIEFAEENINFDVAQLQAMRKPLTKNKLSLILKMISEAQNAAAQLLKDEYKLFRVNLLKDKNFVTKKK